MTLIPIHQRTILWVSVMIAMNSLIGVQASAAESDRQLAQVDIDQNESLTKLNTIVVKATATEEKPIGKVTSGVNKEDIDRRNTNNVVDLLDQISNVSLNGLYARPDISVAIQGIGGRGRVNQSLEGIQQSFEAFSHNFNQSGTILINPAFLSSIDVTQGATSNASSIGNLAGAANFNYINVDDVLSPDQDIGGVFRLQHGIGSWSNGQNLTRTGLFAARDDQWEFLLGASKSSNDNYKMGKNISRSQYLKNSDAYWGGEAYIEQELENDASSRWTPFPNMSNLFIHESGGGSQGSPINVAKQHPLILEGLQDAAKNSVFPGTFRESEGYLFKGKYLFNDEYDQSIALFATSTEVHSQSDVKVDLRIPTLSGISGYFMDPSYYNDNRTKAQVYSIKYDAKFSDLFNPTVTLFHQRLNRTQLWPNEGFYISPSELKNYSSITNTQSTGINIANKSNFSTPYFGGLTLNTALQYKHDKHVPKDFTQNEAKVFGTLLQNQGTYLGKWNPDSETDSLAFSFDLNNHEDTSQWKWNIGAGIQHVDMKVKNAVLETGNVAKEGVIYGYQYFQPEHIAASSSSVRRNWRNGIIDPTDTVALAAYQAYQNHLEESKSLRYDSSVPLSSYIFLTGQNPEHQWNLKAGNFSLQYNVPNSGLSIFGQVAYGERAPTSSEMYMYGNYYKTHIVQSRFLKPESNISLQVGVDYLREALFSDDDTVSLNAHLYHNKIKNYILMGYHQVADSLPGTSYDYAETANGTNPYRLGYPGYINNSENWVTQGLGLNFGYKQPIFYIRGALTVPFDKKNKVCWDEFQGGTGYYETYNAETYSTHYTSAGTGRNVCGNPYKWFSYQTIDPLQLNLTFAVTPMDGKLELGTTLNYRSKQRSYFYVDPGAVDKSGNSPWQLGDYAVQTRFPHVLKVDLFANYKFSDQLKVGLYLANATDQMDMIPWAEYADIMPGRTLTASLEYRHGDLKNIFGYSSVGEDYNWTGWHTGIGLADNKYKMNVKSKTMTDNSISNESGLFDAKTSRYNFHIGHDWKISESPWVVGVEMGFSDGMDNSIGRNDSTKYTNLGKSYSSYVVPTSSIQYDFNWAASLRARLGYTAGRTLFYGLAGISLQNIKQHRTQYQMLNASTNDIYGTKTAGSQATFTESDRDNLLGWNIGVGIEHAITNNLSLRAEYNYTDLGKMSSEFQDARKDANIGYTSSVREQVIVGYNPNTGSPIYEWIAKDVAVAGNYETVNGRKNNTSIKQHAASISLNWRF